MYATEETEVTPLALTTPELLKEIFFWSDKRSNCNSNVLVCKTWMEPCLDIIWREVTDIVRLWKLLGPIRFDYSGQPHELLTPSIPLNWIRFASYARRVRKLETKKLSGHLLFEVVSQRPSSPLLPHLQTLEWRGEIPARRGSFIMFLEPTLQGFILRHSVDTAYNIDSVTGVLTTVAMRSPGLKHITITSNGSAQELGGVILEFLQKISNVSSIELSPFPDMGPFTSALQTFPCLKKLVIGGLASHTNGSDTPCIQSLAQASPEGNHFATLTTLELVAPYSVARELFARYFPSLKRLAISSDLRKTETPGNVKHLLENIAAQCPDLEDLCLSYSLLPQKDYSRFPAPSSLVQMGTLRPILSCTKMRNFTFEHPFPVTLEDRFAEELATSWPELEELYLNHAPLIRRKDFRNCFTLRVLLSFAQLFPRLQHLGLLIAPQSATCPSHAEIKALSAPFRLATFHVGISMLYECDVVQVTGALSLLLPEKCSLLYDKDVGNNDKDSRSTDHKNWKWVKRVIPHMRVMRQESISEKHALEAEIQSLRAQLKLALAP